MEKAFTARVSVVKWKDNKSVSVALNKLRSEPMQKYRDGTVSIKKHLY